jgi:hypothetical protein
MAYRMYQGSIMSPQRLEVSYTRFMQEVDRGNILNLQIIEKSRNALNHKGRTVVQEFYIDQSRTYPVQSALFSINMLVNTEGGRCYSSGEIMSWLKEAGFKEVGVKILDDSVLVSGSNM